jgi:ABC-type branched-subunit amino acid transport system ATPase component
LTAVLNLVGISHRYGGVAALAGVSLAVPPGQLLFLVGPNGAGKTTLLDVASGFQPLQRGRIELDGRDISRLSPEQRVKRGLGRTFQLTRVFKDLTVWENLRVAAVGPRWEEWAWQMLRLTQLDQHLHHFADELSYGQQRLLELARAMMVRPRVVLLDEPAAGVNPVMRQRIMATIAQVRDQTGTTFVIVEHDYELVRRYADRVAMLIAGSKVFDGTVAQLDQEAQALSAFLGDGRP